MLLSLHSNVKLASWSLERYACMWIFIARNYQGVFLTHKGM